MYPFFSFFPIQDTLREQFIFFSYDTCLYPIFLPNWVLLRCEKYSVLPARHYVCILRIYVKCTRGNNIMYSTVHTPCFIPRTCTFMYTDLAPLSSRVISNWARDEIFFPSSRTYNDIYKRKNTIRRSIKSKSFSQWECTIVRVPIGLFLRKKKKEKLGMVLRSKRKDGMRMRGEDYYECERELWNKLVILGKWCGAGEEKTLLTFSSTCRWLYPQNGRSEWGRGCARRHQKLMTLTTLKVFPFSLLRWWKTGVHAAHTLRSFFTISHNNLCMLFIRV